MEIPGLTSKEMTSKMGKILIQAVNIWIFFAGQNLKFYFRFTQQKKSVQLSIWMGVPKSGYLPHLFHGHKSWGSENPFGENPFGSQQEALPGIQLLWFPKKSWDPQIIQKIPSFHFGKFETHSFGDPSFQHISTDPQLRTAALVAMEFAVRR